MPAAIPQLPELSRAELDVIRVLWAEGPLSAREVHDRIAGELDWAYSTTRTVLDRMARKGLVDRSDFHGVFLFAARVNRPQGLARLVRDFAERVLEVEPEALVPLLARRGALTAEELAELTRLLAEVREEPVAAGSGEGSAR